MVLRGQYYVVFNHRESNDMRLGSGIVQFVLHLSVALFFLLQNLVDLLLQLLAIIANRTSRLKSLGLRVTNGRLLDCRLLRRLRLLPITTNQRKRDENSGSC